MPLEILQKAVENIPAFPNALKNVRKTSPDRYLKASAMSCDRKKEKGPQVQTLRNLQKTLQGKLLLALVDMSRSARWFFDRSLAASRKVPRKCLRVLSPPPVCMGEV